MSQSLSPSRPAAVMDLATEPTRSSTREKPANILARGFMDPETLDAQSAFYVRFLDIIHDTDGVRANQRRIVDLLDLQEGFHLLDVGCGTGSFTREAAALVGSTGRVVGVDLSPTLIGVARQRGAGLGLPVEFDVADARRLPFADDMFDGCRIERVLQYLDHPQRALAEMVRVTRPGGRIVATEVDWDTIISDLPEIDRNLYRRVSRAMSDSAGNGWMGRELRRRLLDLDLEDVTCEGAVAIITDANSVLDGIGRRHTLARLRDAGAISVEECGRLIAAEEASGQAGRYFTAFTLFTASGRKPLQA